MKADWTLFANVAWPIALLVIGESLVACYEVVSLLDDISKRGFDLISDALPFGKQQRKQINKQTSRVTYD